LRSNANAAAISTYAELPMVNESPYLSTEVEQSPLVPCVLFILRDADISIDEFRQLLKKAQ